MLKCHASPMRSAQRASRKTTAASPTSPSLTLMESCAKHATSNWVTTQSCSHLAPWVRMVTPSSNTTYLLPPHTTNIPPLSCSLCGSSMPYWGRCPPSTRPWSWHTGLMIGAWPWRSPTTMSQTPASSTSWRKYTCLTVSSMLSKWQVVRAAPDLREPTLITVYEAFRPSTPIALLMPMCTRRDSASAVVGRHS